MPITWEGSKKFLLSSSPKTRVKHYIHQIDVRHHRFFGKIKWICWIGWFWRFTFSMSCYRMTRGARLWGWMCGCLLRRNGGRVGAFEGIHLKLFTAEARWIESTTCTKVVKWGSWRFYEPWSEVQWTCPSEPWTSLGNVRIQLHAIFEQASSLVRSWYTGGGGLLGKGPL